jgi:hypothetical protein
MLQKKFLSPLHRPVARWYISALLYHTAAADSIKNPAVCFGGGQALIWRKAQ